MSVPFALTIKLKSPPAYDPSKGPPSIPGFKKGRSIVIRNPRRKGVKEGKMGFLEVQEGEFLVCFLSLLVGLRKVNGGGRRK